MGLHAPAGQNRLMSLEGACLVLGPEGAHGAGHPEGRASQCAKSWHFSVRIVPPGPSMQGATDHGSGSSGRWLPDPGGVHRIGVGADSVHAVTVRSLRRWATSVGCSPCSLQSLFVAVPVPRPGPFLGREPRPRPGITPKPRGSMPPTNRLLPTSSLPARVRLALHMIATYRGRSWPGASVRRAFHPARAPCTWRLWMSCAST
jgi:hypothetical protein